MLLVPPRKTEQDELQENRFVNFNSYWSGHLTTPKVKLQNIFMTFFYKLANNVMLKYFLKVNNNIVQNVIFISLYRIMFKFVYFFPETFKEINQHIETHIYSAYISRGGSSKLSPMSQKG